MKNPYVLAGLAVFLLVGAYLFGVEGVVELFKALMVDNTLVLPQ